MVFIGFVIFRNLIQSMWFSPSLTASSIISGVFIKQLNRSCQLLKVSVLDHTSCSWVNTLLGDLSIRSIPNPPHTLTCKTLDLQILDGAWIFNILNCTISSIFVSKHAAECLLHYEWNELFWRKSTIICELTGNRTLTPALPFRIRLGVLRPPLSLFQLVGPPLGILKRREAAWTRYLL